MTAVASGARGTDPLIDAGLSLIWPGLGQLNQGRPFIGLYFAVETITLASVLVLAPAWRIPSAIGLLMFTLWSMSDAYRGARTDARRA